MYEAFHASKSSPIHWRILETHIELCLLGEVVDRIKVCGDVLNSPNRPNPSKMALSLPIQNPPAPSTHSNNGSPSPKPFPPTLPSINPRSFRPYSPHQRRHLQQRQPILF